MAQGIIKSDSVFAVVEESAEGTYAAPASATGGYFQPNSEGVESSPVIELVERPIMTNGLGKAAPRGGMRGNEVKIPVELRGSGTEGSAPQHGVLFESLLGSVHAITANVTTKASGNTGSELQIEDADIAKFAVNDMFVVKETGAHQVCFVTAIDSTVGSASVTVTPAKPTGNFSNSVVLSKSVTYKPADTGHPPFSFSQWDAGTVLRKYMGCRAKAMSLENFVTGQIASFNFDAEGLSFDEIDGVPPHTPTYDSALPPIILSAIVYIDGTAVNVNEVGLSVEQALGFIQATGNANGKVTGYATGKRDIKGTIAPYKDDTAVTYFTKFTAGTSMALILTAHCPSSTTGEFSLGTVCGLYLPQIIITGKKVDDLNGVLRDVLEFGAHCGVVGGTPEIALGFV